MADKVATAAHYDLIVIGTGPGGEGAAMKAVKCGKRVAAIEQYSAVGGGATHWGTIPSKALRRAIYHMNMLSQNPVYKRLDVKPEFPFPELVASANSVVEEQADQKQGFYDNNNVPLIPGHARFVDPHRIEVIGEGNSCQYLSADGFIIATGSRPYRPKNIDFDHPRIFDSDTLLKMPFTPGSIAVFGAGVIGCEYASMLRATGMGVTLLDTRDKLLAFLDEEIIDALSYHFANSGIDLLHNEDIERVDGQEKEVLVYLKSGKRLRCEAFLFTNGRSGNTENLNLETIGVTPTSRGQLEVNSSYQVKRGTGPETHDPGAANPPNPQDPAAGKASEPDTFHPHIYAVGDVIGWPSLASASYDQGRFAASHFCGDADYRLVQDIPTGIYTSPEISSLGKTERQLTEAKVPYAVGKALFRTLARAQITGETVGMLKLLFHRDSLELLGVHCFGDNAAEIIHIGQAIMAQSAPNNTINYFLHTTFNYPTMAEAYRVAALRGINSVFR